MTAPLTASIRPLAPTDRATWDRLGAARVCWMTHETNAMARLPYDRLATRSGFIQYRR